MARVGPVRVSIARGSPIRVLDRTFVPVARLVSAHGHHGLNVRGNRQPAAAAEGSPARSPFHEFHWKAPEVTQTGTGGPLLSLPLVLRMWPS